MLITAFRKFWAFFVAGPLVGGGVGLLASFSLVDEVSPTQYEGTITSIALTYEEAEALALERLRAQSAAAEIVWFFPTEGGGGPRADTVAKRLLSPSSQAELADETLISVGELSTRIAVVEPGSSDLLEVSVWAESDTDLDLLISAVSRRVAALDVAFYPAQTRSRLVDVDRFPASLAADAASSEIRTWTSVALTRSGLADSSSVNPGLRDWPSKVLSIYNGTENGGPGYGREAPEVSVVAQDPNRIIGTVRHESQDVVSAALGRLASAFESSSELAFPNVKANQLVLVDESHISQFGVATTVAPRTVVIVSGVVLGLFLSVIYALLVVSQRRILWLPSQFFAIHKTAPVAVLGRESPDAAGSTFRACDRGVKTLRTNLFFDGSETRVVFLTPSGVGEIAAGVAEELAGSLSHLGHRVALVHATGVAPKMLAQSGKAPELPAHLVAVGASPGGVSAFSLDPRQSREPSFYLSDDWGEVLSWLRQSYDYILVVTSPVLSDWGATEAATRDSKTVLVVELGVSLLYDFASARTRLLQSGLPRVEVLVIGVPVADESYWHHYPFTRPD